MSRVYATPEDLESYVDQVPTNSSTLLEIASAQVDAHVLTVRYSTDPAGYPSDYDLREAFRQATCLQVAAWADTGVSPIAGVAGAAGRVVASSGIGKAQVTLNVQAQAAARAHLVGHLTEVACQILNRELANNAHVPGYR